MFNFFSSSLATISKSKFAGNVLKLGSGTALGQGLVVLSTPILTRLYDPTEMGILGIFMAFVGFLSVGVGLRLEMAIVSAHDDREADHLLAAALAAVFPTSILSGLIMLGLIHYNLLSYGILPIWSVPAVVVSLAFTGIFTSVRYWYVRKGDFSGVSKALVFQGAGRSLVPVFLGIIHVGWIGLLIGEIIGRTLGVWQLIRVAWPHMIKSLLPFQREYCTSLLKKNWKYPVIVLPSSLLDSLGSMVSLPIVATLFGAKEAGLFLLVQRLVSLPAGFVSASIADVFHSHVSDAFRVDSCKVRSVLLVVTKKLLLISIAIYAPLALLAPIVFGFIFGETWVDAGYLLSIISIVSLTGMVVSPVSRLLLVVNKQELKLFVDIIRLLVPNLCIFVMHYNGYNFWESMIAFSLMSTLAYCFYYCLIWRCSNSPSEKPSET